MYVSRLGKSEVIFLLPSSIVFLELRLPHHKKARASTPRLSSACNGPRLIDPRVYQLGFIGLEMGENGSIEEEN